MFTNPPEDWKKNLSLYLSIYLSIYLFIYVSVYLSVSCRSLSGSSTVDCITGWSAVAICCAGFCMAQILSRKYTLDLAEYEVYGSHSAIWAPLQINHTCPRSGIYLSAEVSTVDGLCDNRESVWCEAPHHSTILYLIPFAEVFSVGRSTGSVQMLSRKHILP